MLIQSSPTAAPRTNRFTEKQVKNGMIGASYAEQTADTVAFLGTTAGVAAGAALLGELGRHSLVGGLVITAVGVVAGAVTGAISTPMISQQAHRAFGADYWNDGGREIGGGILGALAGGAGAVAGCFGGSPGQVALWALGTSAVFMGGTAGINGR